MSHADILAILPQLFLLGTAVLLLVAIAVRRRYAVNAAVTLIGLGLTLVSLGWALAVVPRQITPLLLIDGYALYFTGLLTAASLAIAMLAYGYWATLRDLREEFFVLLVLATLGASILAASTHFASFFLGLEIMSAAIYGLVAYCRDYRPGIEAGIKYLVLAGVASAFILLGMALLYTDLGSMQLGALSAILAARPAFSALTGAGIAMLLVGFGFKLALPPFHLWTPDVYQGAPAPVSAFIATVSKGAMFALLLRYFFAWQVARHPALWLVFATLSIAAMFTGNLLALQQQSIKRILAYSSIANMVYLLVAFLAGGLAGAAAVIFYLSTYFITVLTAFGVITVLTRENREVDLLEDYRGLAWRHPWLTLLLSASLLSLAGIPITAGFIGKFLVLATGVGARLWALVIIMVLNSGLGLFYYLRVVLALFRHPEEEPPLPEAQPPTTLMKFPLAVIALLVLILLLVTIGIYPGPVLRLIESLLTI